MSIFDSIGHEFRKLGDVVAHDVKHLTQEAKDILDKSENELDKYLDDLKKGVRDGEEFMRILRNLNFDEASPPPAIDPGQLKAKLSQATPQAYSKLASIRPSPDIIRTVAKRNGLDSKIDQGGEVAKKHNYLMAVGETFTAVSIVGYTGGFGFWWTQDKDWGIYFTGGEGMGGVINVSVEASYTYIFPKYGKSAFKGEGRAISVAFTIPGIETGFSLTLLETPTDDIIGFSIGVGSGVGDPLPIPSGYYAITTTGVIQL